MTLHAQTSFFAMFSVLLLTSIALVVGLDLKQSRALRAWTIGVVLQSIAWALLLAAFFRWELVLSSLGAGALSASLACWYVAMCHFLRRTPSRAWVIWIPIGTTVLHALLFSNFAARVFLLNSVYATQLLWSAWLLIHGIGRSKSQYRWRLLGFLSAIFSCPVLLGRAFIAVFAPDQYSRFETDNVFNVVGQLLSGGSVVVGTLAMLLAHRAEAERELRRLATVDGLTGLLNRRVLFERGELAIELARRHGLPLTAVMLDLDHFKAINDKHGHSVGDQVIGHFASLLTAQLRATDQCGRYGGEEFALVLPMTDLAAAATLDRRVRDALNSQAVQGVSYRYSAGAAQWIPGQSLTDLLANADAALYEAKRSGRGRLCSHVPPVTQAQTR